MPEATNPAADSQPLVGASEAAEIMGVELSTFSHLRRREESVEGSKFPKPMAILRCGPVWKTTEIQKFAKRYVAPRPGPKPAATSAAPAKATKATKATKAAPKTTPAVKVMSTVKASDKSNGNVVKLNGKPTVKKVSPRKVVAKKVPATV